MAQNVLTIILIISVIIMIIGLFKKPSPGTQPFIWQVSKIFSINNHLKTQGAIMSKQAQVDQKFNASWPAPKDKYGNETTVADGSVQFSSDDEAIASVEADSETGPFACKIKTNSATGATAIRIKAKSADGSTDLEGQLAVEVLAGDAVAFGDPTTTDAVDDEDED